MKKINYLYLLLFTFLFLFSCNKDDDPKDIRDDLAGTYDYKIKVYEVQQNGNIVYLPELDEVGTMTTKKQSGTIYDDVITFTNGNRDFFTAYDFVKHKDGITLNIVSHSRVIEGKVIFFEGLDRIDLNGSDYEGVYFYADKRVKAAMQVTYSDGLTIMSELEAIKQ